MPCPAGRRGSSYRRGTARSSGLQRQGQNPWLGGGSTKEAADFDPVIVGVKEVLTMAHSELCSFFAKPSLYVSVLRLALRPWVSLVHINH